MRRRPPLRRAADALEWAAARALLAATSPLGPDRLSDLAAALGRRLAHWIPGLQARVAGNLRLTDPEAPPARARALTAACGAAFARTVAEYMRMERLAAEPHRLSVTGAAPLRAALAAGRGAVIVTAHFGQWEAIRLGVRAETGRDCALIYRAFNNPRVDRMAQAMIRPAGLPVLHKGPAGARALLRQVGQGGAALILIDQRQTGAPLVPFLGVPAETATAAADLALRFDAPLIPALGRRIAPGRFEVRFAAPIPPGDALTMTAAANAVLSDWIRAEPEQWFWFHRRWRRRPRGEAIRAARAG